MKTLIPIIALGLVARLAFADQVWVQRYDGPGRFNRATAVAVDSAGNVAVTGFSDNTTDDPNNYGFNDSAPNYDARGRADYYTAKYAAGDGHLLWENRYNGPSHGDDVATDVKMDANGNVIVTGYSLDDINGNPQHSFYTAKYASADGALLWERRGPGWPFHDVRLALDRAGNVVVTGATSGDPYWGGFYTAKYAAADGSVLWEQRFNTALNGRTYTVGAPAIDSDGNVAVTGTASIDSDEDSIYTEKYAAGDGHVLWAQRYQTPGSVMAGNAVTVDSAGNVIVAGTSIDGSVPNPFLASYYRVIKYAAATGQLLWEQQYHTPTWSSACVAVDGDGNIALAAASPPNLGNPAAFSFAAKYSADGQQLWLRPYQSCNPGGDYPMAIGFNSAGDVIVAGIGYDGDSIGFGHYHTVRYAAADGQVVWQANYIGPGNLNNARDTAAGLAVDTLGNVIVTGYSQTSSGDYFSASFGYATVKYLPSASTSTGRIICPANIVTPNDPGQCSAIVNFTLPAANDECGNPLIVIASPASGSAFPKGTTPVTCTASDGSSCGFTVTVNDTQAPSITCPGNISVSCGMNFLAPVTFSATATDNCDPQPTLSYSPASGSGFPVGTTTVTCTATDSSGNQSHCNFTVTRAAIGFTGFLSPIGGADATSGSFSSPVRTFKLNSTIPVKFTASCGGSPVLSGIHRLQVIKYTSQTVSGTPIDATPTDAATTGDQFVLDGGEWHFNLDTKDTGMTAGIWLLQATLSDGSQHTAWIQVK